MKNKKVLVYLFSAALVKITVCANEHSNPLATDTSELRHTIDQVTVPNISESSSTSLTTSSSDASLAMHSSSSASEGNVCASTSTIVSPFAESDALSKQQVQESLRDTVQQQRADVQNETSRKTILLPSRVPGGRPSLCIVQQSVDAPAKVKFPSLFSPITASKRHYPSNSILSESHQDTALWRNDNSFAAMKPLRIVNGSLIACCGSGVVSNGIRLQTKQDNPLGVSHVGIALTATATEIGKLIDLSAKSGGLHFNQKSRKVKASHEYMINMIKKLDRNKQDVFCLHSTGKYGVHIVPLSVLTTEYDGDIYVRILHESIPLADMIQIIARDVGKKYNFSIKELQHCATDKNTKADNMKEFCSQLVACIYQECGIIPETIIATNATPAEFSSHCPDNWLAAVGGKEEILKIGAPDGCCSIM
ncbi:MAG: hypothetical protein LBD36_00050 [Holosporales bacterium]|jgi:hypothetical protein|nr:hypothetical protein [Holosporales bacterium]